MRPPHKTTCSPKRSVSGLFEERRFDDSRTTGADAACVGERGILRPAGGILVNGDERRYSPAFLVDTADEMTGALRRNHVDIHILRRYDLAEMNIETVREHESVTRLETLRNITLINPRLKLVGQKNLNDVGFFGCFSGAHGFESGLYGDLIVLGAFEFGDDDIEA